MVRKKEKNTQLLLDTIIESIQEKKGNNVICLDFRKIGNSICDYFVICDAESSRQVDAIADFVEDNVYNKLKDKVIHKEGQQNALWILLDFMDIVVHVFQKEQRDFYNLENLWADAEAIRVPAPLNPITIK